MEYGGLNDQRSPSSLNTLVQGLHRQISLKDALPLLS
jgi:hypothetical protein